MPHSHTPPAPTQPDLCPLCALRRTGGSSADSIGRYTLTGGAQYRCSACDTWLCADCAGSPVAGLALPCGACSTTQEPQGQPQTPPAGGLGWVVAAQPCGRPLKSKAGRCPNSPTQWPTIPGEPEPVRACWTHLSKDERQRCTRARSLRDAERARAWAAGAPERERRAAEAEAERLARLAACPCSEQLPEDAGPFSTDYPLTTRCKECDSWLCASCGRVRVGSEGEQCETCQPHATTPAPENGPVPEGAPHYRITVGSLEDEYFTDAMSLLIRAGARNAGTRRTFAVALPICPSQAEAVAHLETCAGGSETGRIVVELVASSAEATVDPALPQPDLSGLGDIDTWWSANGYPPKGHRPK